MVLDTNLDFYGVKVKVKGHFLSIYHHNLGSNRVRSMIFLLYPHFRGQPVEWRHFQTCTTNRVATLTQQGCQIAGLLKVNHVITIQIE